MLFEGSLDATPLPPGRYRQSIGRKVGLNHRLADAVRWDFIPQGSGPVLSRPTLPASDSPATLAKRFLDVSGIVHSPNADSQGISASAVIVDCATLNRGATV